MDYEQVCQVVGQLYLKLYEVQLELDKELVNNSKEKEEKKNAAD